MRWCPPWIAPASRDQCEDVVLGGPAFCQGRASPDPDLLHKANPSCPGGRNRKGGMVETGIADSLILVDVPLKSMGCCSRKKLDKDLGFGSGRGSVFSLFIL